MPAVFRDAYATAFQQFGWAGDAAAMIVFGLMVKFRENFFQDEDKNPSSCGISPGRGATRSGFRIHRFHHPA